MEESAVTTMVVTGTIARGQGPGISCSERGLSCSSFVPGRPTHPDEPAGRHRCNLSGKDHSFCLCPWSSLSSRRSIRETGKVGSKARASASANDCGRNGPLAAGGYEDVRDGEQSRIRD